MGIATAAEIQASLLGAGAPEAAAVEIVVRASHPDARVIRTTLGAMVETVAAEAVENPAMLLIEFPKAVAFEAAARARA